jgi:hypothetical protein
MATMKQVSDSPRLRQSDEGLVGVARTRKVRLADGREGVAMVIPVNNTTENWNEYLLDDGTVLKIKIVLTEVMRVEGEFDPQGNPMYLVNSQPVVNVDAPDEL